MPFRSLAEVQHAIKSGNTSLLEITQQYLSKIREKEYLNIFLEVFADEAVLKAGEIDKKIANGTAGKLAGMVIAIKDNICYKDHKTSASSKILEGFVSIFHATAIERLLSEDAIIIGRTNCDEFAMGGSNENSAYGKVLNPLDEKSVPGGSSGGSAAAVAANMCLAALGSDTGGSIRQPAAFCGVVGVKPTYGRVSRHGLLAYASSFDQIGPITHTVADAALIMEVISGADNYDSTASKKEVPPYSRQLAKPGKLKIGFVKDCMESNGLDPEIKKNIEENLQKLATEGHQIEPVDFGLLEYLVPAYYVLTTAEASSNLSRYDGIHYGYRSKKATDIDSTYVLSRTEGFGEEVKRRIMLGTFVLSSGYYDAYYSKAQKVRRIIREKTLAALEKYDFLILPTTPTTAFKPGEKTTDPIVMYLQDIFTVQANLAGVPAISIPVGNHSNGLPFGLQIMAKPFEESAMLAFADHILNNHS